MKTLVVYFSKSGNTKKVADIIASVLDADTDEIIEDKDRSGVLGYIFSGRDAMMKKPADIRKPGKDPADYDLVVVGTPIWAWTVTPAVRGYLIGQKDKLKRVAFYCTEGSSGGKKAFKQMEEASGIKPEACLELTAEELTRCAEGAKLRDFTDKLK